jgi:ABC-2 type transport system ATP-binding protein
MNIGENTMTYALEANLICKNFLRKNKKPVQALQDVNLRIPQNTVYGLLGPNGSGKSTFIRIASTLLIPDSGQLSILGHDVKTQSNDVKWLINRVSVEASFFRNLSAFENLLFSAGLYGVSRKSAIQRIFDITDRIGLDRKRLNERIRDYSRGMQQKVAIARALITQPPVLLLDEPTTGLDPRAKLEVQELIRVMREKLDVTIVLTTHDMTEAEKMCDKVAIIHNGKVVVDGDPDYLMEQLPKTQQKPTFEEVFLHFTGVDFTEAEKEVSA